MPQLPKYESNKQISQPRVGQGAIVQSPVGGEQYEGMQTMAKEAEGVVTQWQKAQDTMDYTKAKNQYEMGIARVKAEAANDTNPDNANTYLLELQSLKADFAGNFHNKELAQVSSLELDHDIDVASLEIGATFKKKQVFQNKINLGSTIEVLAEQKRNALNPMLAQEAQEKIDSLIQANLVNGTITESEARNFKSMQVKSDILSDESVREKDSTMLRELRKGKNGAYAYLSENERLNSIEDLQSRIFHNNQSYQKDIEFAQTDGVISAAQSIVEQKFTSQDIETGAKLGIFDADAIRVFTEAIGKKRITPKKKIAADAYLGLLKNNLKDNVTAKQVIYNATKEWQNKTIKDDEYGYFIQQSQRMLENERNGKTGFDPLTLAFKGAVFVIEQFSKMQNYNLPQVTEELTRKLIESGKTNTPEDIKSETEKLINNKIKEMSPSTQLLDDIPNSVTNESGELKILSTQESKAKANYKFVPGKGIVEIK